MTRIWPMKKQFDTPHVYTTVCSIHRTGLGRHVAPVWELYIKSEGARCSNRQPRLLDESVRHLRRTHDRLVARPWRGASGAGA